MDHPMSTGVRSEKGSATTELVLATPLLLVLMLLAVQFAVWMHATHIAQASAAQALSVARGTAGSAEAGQGQAETVLGQVAQGMLLDPAVEVTQTNQQVLVRIRGTASSVIPWMHLPVDVTAAGPTERWTT
jgi:Flp pilus assembly protein TadG